jgi:hypothetical protein
MPLEREAGGDSLIDVLDRILDKGIVIDAWARVSFVGVDLITVEVRVVVASIETYLQFADALSTSLRASPPSHGHEIGDGKKGRRRSPPRLA